VVMAASLLSACGSSQKKEDSIAPDPFAARPATTAQSDQFGKGFEEASRAGPNSEPRKVSDGDVRPVSLTEEPMEVH
jgi:ABC-type Fe3+-hydroxamate transport system substrate-binding protein